MVGSVVLARPPATATPVSGAPGGLEVEAMTNAADPAAPAPSVEEARGDKLLLRFEGKRCIHSRQCVLGAPSVFLANVKGPWLHPDARSVEALVEVAHACPSGAVTYERLDGGPAESAPPVNLARVRENGPVALHGDLQIAGHGAMLRATLCRCGASKNKPFCDGSHGRPRRSPPPANCDAWLERAGSRCATAQLTLTRPSRTARSASRGAWRSSRAPDGR